MAKTFFFDHIYPFMVLFDFIDHILLYLPIFYYPIHYSWLIYVNNQTRPILAHNYPLIYINLHVQYGSNLIRTFGVKIQNLKKKKLGVGGNNQTGPILANIYPLIYINLHVKYGKYLIRTFWVKIQIWRFIFSGSWGHYIKSRVPGHQNVSKCIFHHSGDIYIHMEKQLLKKCLNKRPLGLTAPLSNCLCYTNDV